MSEPKTNGAESLLGPVQIRQLASRLGVSPTKKFGQNFVHDPGTVRKIVREAGVSADDLVVEVGPGLGSLTLALLETGAYTSAVEIDPVLAKGLPQTVQTYQASKAYNFGLLLCDALKITGPADFAIPPALRKTISVYEPTHLVANLPYNVAVPVLLTFLEKIPSLQRVTVMVQMEVASRLAASPGSRTYGVPSVKANWYAEVSKGSAISRQIFWPVPNVDSGLVHLERRATTWGDESLRREVFTLVDAAFAQRRKTLRSALASWAGSAQTAEELLLTAGINPQERGEKLDIADFVALAQAKIASSSLDVAALTENI